LFTSWLVFHSSVNDIRDLRVLSVEDIEVDRFVRYIQILKDGQLEPVV